MREALRTGRGGPVADLLALGDALLDAVVVDIGWREHAERGGVVLVLAPVDEVRAGCTRILRAAEPLGEVGPVLEPPKTARPVPCPAILRGSHR